MSFSEDQIRDALKQVKYPGFSRDIISFGIVKSIKVEENRCTVAMELTASDPKVADQIKLEAEAALRKLGFKESLVTIGLKAATPGAFQHAPVSGIRYSIAVASGKGGVGKSTVSVNLSIALSKLGAKVGLMDSDIFGPSIPLMMNAKTPPIAEGDKIIPTEAYGIKLMSMGFLVDANSPVVWRGPMVTRTIQQFIHNVAWGDLDYLVIDLPPGTGDAQLSLCQTIPLTGSVVVTTPQEVALIDVRKAVGMFEKVNVPILGIIENMSYFLCPSDNKRYDIFGSGGGQREAERLKVPLFGQIPIEMAIREGGDSGVPITISNPDSASGKAFLQTAEALRKRFP
jgi:ATP-binding protein involved in chromosome partitioning